MPLPEPSSKKDILNAEGIWEDYGLAGIALVMAVGMGLRYLRLDPPDYPTASLLLVAGVMTILIQWSKISKKKNAILTEECKPDVAIEAILEVLHNTLVRIRDDGCDAGLRITIYRLSKDKKTLIQHTRYFGVEDEEPSKEPHKVPVEKGVIGIAYRTQEIQTAVRHPDSCDEQFRQDMVHGFSYTYEEACGLSHDRFSWMAIPVVERSGVHSILFCDSKLHNFFGNKAGIRYRILEAACGGLAHFLARQ